MLGSRLVLVPRTVLRTSTPLSLRERTLFSASLPFFHSLHTKKPTFSVGLFLERVKGLLGSRLVLVPRTVLRTSTPLSLRERTLFSASLPFFHSLHTKKPTFSVGLFLERVKGFEPSTSTLARLRSTPELRPHLLFFSYDTFFSFLQELFSLFLLFFLIPLFLYSFFLLTSHFCPYISLAARTNAIRINGIVIRCPRLNDNKSACSITRCNAQNDRGTLKIVYSITFGSIINPLS